ncbi:hypothetical protein [Janthinobacterium fluminis]|uniref:Secreted protein n=1 Tax=Janthinobacterium fluminis TaxID=2987524 RepID=A0ABT5K0S8_9BURK|nr:hypothetical protein [Janthinobacterium fluminis]MDC8758459.1 hypothetical protein [Janthinobacterium fluminis]
MLVFIQHYFFGCCFLATSAAPHAGTGRQGRRRAGAPVRRVLFFLRGRRQSGAFFHDALAPFHDVESGLPALAHFLPSQEITFRIAKNEF